MAMTTPAGGVQRPIERALRGRHELGEQTSEEVAERRKQGQGEDHGEVIHPGCALSPGHPTSDGPVPPSSQPRDGSATIEQIGATAPESGALESCVPVTSWP
jgi:hypothetical protein